MGVVHHVRGVAAGRAHVGLQAHEIADFPEPLAGLGQAEELEMDKPALDAEGLEGGAAAFPQLFRDLRQHEVRHVQVAIDNVHDGPRKMGAGLEQGIAVAVADGVVGVDFAGDELFHHVGDGGLDGEEGVQFRVAADLVGGLGADADFRLHDHRVAHILQEGTGGFRRGDLELTGCRDVGLGVVDFLGGLALELGDVLQLDAGGDVEVRSEAGVQFQPVFVVGLEPVDFAVFVGEPGDGPEGLVVVFHRGHVVVFREVCLQFGREGLIGGVADAEDIDTPAAETFAEIPVGLREIGGYEDEVHSDIKNTKYF